MGGGGSECVLSMNMCERGFERSHLQSQHWPSPLFICDSFDPSNSTRRQTNRKETHETNTHARAHQHTHTHTLLSSHLHTCKYLLMYTKHSDSSLVFILPLPLPPPSLSHTHMCLLGGVLFPCNRPRSNRSSHGGAKC